MPELTVIHYGLMALILVAGLAGGWFLRADRCAKEKIAVGAIWQDKLESRQAEQDRLAEQNKSLMEQISQYQASHQDYSNRAKELSESLQKSNSRRDELQSQIKDIRNNLEVAVVQRDRLQTKMHGNSEKQRAEALKDRDDKIFRLSRELTSWQNRLPPLVEKFKERNDRIQRLEKELEQVHARLKPNESDQTRIESVDADSLTNGGDASNEPIATDSAHDTSALYDQINEEANEDDLVSVLSEDDAFAAVFASTDDDSAVDVDQPKDNGDYDDASNDDSSNDNSSNYNSADDHDEADISDSDPEQDDDLMKIKGIGPAIAKTLNELGIRQFQQIAGMSEYDIDRIAQQLKGFRSRIYREDWIGQARELRDQKAGR